MKLFVFTLFSMFVISIGAYAQVDARLMRYPDVSQSHITFVYGDDIWIVEKTGGTAVKLSSPAGEEMFPRFSPNGREIAFSANYEGNVDIYMIPVLGGVPTRLTYHGMGDRMLDWHPSGDEVLFASSRESGRQRYNQFYTVSTAGGMPVKLDIPYGEYASYSDDGQSVAYTDRSRVHRTWKRYRGGTAPDIRTFRLSDHSTRRITDHDANDELPMWHGNIIYFLSDRGDEQRANLWKFDFDQGSLTQLTNFEDFDIHYPSIGPFEIVFQAGDELYLFSLETETYEAVDINLVTDRMNLLPTQKNVGSMIQDAALSPDGNRVVIQARGELFSLPAKEGYVANLSRSSGSAERSPAWSPDGRYVACWSDAQGEYQLTLFDMSEEEPRTVTSFEDGFRYSLYWSPNSKYVAYIDQAMRIQVLNVETGAISEVDQGRYMFQGALQGFDVSWSPDSKWIAYAREMSRVTNAIFMFEINGKKRYQVTSGYYHDRSPEFSADGKYLFYVTGRQFSPSYSDLDNTFIYANTSQVAAVPLSENIPSLLAVKNDAVELGEENEEDEDEEDSSVNINLQNFEQRAELLDIESGNISNLSAVEGKLLFMRYPNTGDSNGSSSLNYYDLESREVKQVIDNVSGYDLSANGKKILVRHQGKHAVIPVSEGASVKEAVPTDKMVMMIDPRKEWMQIFNDAWRFERDFFYDPNMHGVDWNDMRDRYGSLIEQANSRNDVNFILGELIGELNASHTYRGGGDTENADQLNVGYLGADYAIENGAYRIREIISAAPWDIEAMSPLNQPGLDVNEGDYILAVNGAPVDTSRPIHAWLQGQADNAVELTVNQTPEMTGSRKVIVRPMSSETRLRHLAWIEKNRSRVEEATDGRIGYVYVRSTGIDGQNELIRQYYAQIDKEGMIIDERFNSGGQIPDRFIEMLDREPLAFWAVRDGKDWGWPPVANFGPKVMLINGFSGSGGDAFPDYFRKAELGPLVGTRTWGGLIGISGAPLLIDNGTVTVPTFRMYDPDGEWFKEGHGVDPDIEVEEDFTALADGTDVQLEAAIEEALRLLNESTSFERPSRPHYEKR